jgi:hypothetical protein
VFFGAWLVPRDPLLYRLLRHVKLERGLAVGASLLLVGAGLWLGGLSYWSSMHFGNLNPARALRIVIPGIVCLMLGFQVTLSSFFLSVLNMERQR